ncbi:hypothetical protein APP_21890 [Aeribacillus pallidus]|nr:hypothetical protein APP_21890 [Aeribacillus pallidus]
MKLRKMMCYLSEDSEEAKFWQLKGKQEKISGALRSEYKNNITNGKIFAHSVEKSFIIGLVFCEKHTYGGGICAFNPAGYS